MPKCRIDWMSVIQKHRPYGFTVHCYCTVPYLPSAESSDGKSFGFMPRARNVTMICESPKCENPREKNMHR